MSVIISYKPIGKTPADIVNYYKILYPNSKICFSGRLDPMAHGKMHILLDDEVNKSELYNKLDKTYKFSVIVGIETDTTDILGFIKTLQSDTVNIDIEDIIQEFFKMININEQEYHVYSSFVIKKHPLWWYANNNKLHEINIPSKPVTIYEISYLKTDIYNNIELKTNILNRLNELIKNNHMEFRTKEIYEQWNNIELYNNYTILTFETTVSYGFYIRQLVKDISKILNIPLCVLDIERINLYKI